MIHLEVFGESAAMSSVAGLLDEVEGVSRARVVRAARTGHSVVSATVQPRAVDAVLEALRRQAVPDTDVVGL